MFLILLSEFESKIITMFFLGKSFVEFYESFEGGYTQKHG